MLAQGEEAIRECESRLRELMSKASAAGEYDTVIKLMDWAKAVASVLDRPIAQPSLERENSTSANPVDLAPSITSKQPSKPKTTRSRYPRFTKYRNDLVKIGWSKKERKEYQHRAPRKVVDLLCARLEFYRGKDFTSDELWPLRGDDDQEIPSYQAYLCLAWFREIGIIVKNGRHGYFIDSKVDLKAATEDRWNQLSIQR